MDLKALRILILIIKQSLSNCNSVDCNHMFMLIILFKILKCDKNAAYYQSFYCLGWH